MKSILFFIILLLTSCSTLNKNMIKKGAFAIDGGVYKTLKWDSKLKFDRVSWFKELTLMFDVFLTSVKKEDPFYEWFSEGEKLLVSSCLDAKVVLTYSWDPMQISRGSFFSEAEKYGYERYSIPDFHSNVKMHPNFARINVYLYKTALLCRKKLTPENLVVTFPGWNTVSIP